tara:strand:- start:1634 stop:2008 length:375 start_codon:yes stop_codon:yes gene_type:complete
VTPGEARDRAIIAGMATVFPPALLLARDALLLWAKDHEPEGWPTVTAVIRFAAAHEVSAQELGALVGIISFRLTPRGKVVWADSWRRPEIVTRTPPGRLTSRVLRAYGCYVATAARAVAARQVH